MCTHAEGFPGDSVVKTNKQTNKNLQAKQEMQEAKVWLLGQEDALEKEMTTHSSIFAWWATVHVVANIQTRLSD